MAVDLDPLFGFTCWRGIIQNFKISPRISSTTIHFLKLINSYVSRYILTIDKIHHNRRLKTVMYFRRVCNVFIDFTIEINMDWIFILLKATAILITEPFWKHILIYFVYYFHILILVYHTCWLLLYIFINKNITLYRDR